MAVPSSGGEINKLLTSRLPERFAGRVPSLVIEIVVGLLAAGSLLALRLALIPLVGDRAPYAFVFLSVVIACVIAGWRSGLVAIAAGQLLIWYLVVEPSIIFAHGRPGRFGGLAISTISQLIILTVITFYQREIARGEAERELRMELLDNARRELDHRAKNNYQTVLSLIQLQSGRETDPNVKLALQQVADRIGAISVATDHLAIRSEDLAMVRLRDHLSELCAQLERGLARGDVHVECDFPDVTASSDTAIHLALIVNELVTNSLKHAFGDGGSGVVRISSKVVDGGGLEILVSDNGNGMKANSSSSGTGLGRRLVETFARHLDAKVEISSSAAGTAHKILVPALA